MNKSIHAIITLSILSSLNAITLKDTIKQTLLSNEQITSNNLNVEAVKTKIKQEKSAYYPKLDFESYLQKEKDNSNYDDIGVQKSTIDGYNIALKARQPIYNGGDTKNRVKQAQYAYKSELNKAYFQNDDILLDIVNSYIDIIKFDEQSQYSSFLTQANKDALVVAKDKEEISGEALPTQETIVLYKTQLDREHIQNMKYENAKNNFEKLTSLKAENLCKPEIDTELFNVPLNDVIKIALANNYKVKREESLLNEQKYFTKNATANYKPSLELDLQASYDDDLEHTENGTKKDLLGKLLLTWNLYNGGRDKLKKQEETIRLQAKRKDLEFSKKQTIQKVSDSYYEYHRTLKRIADLKDSVIANEKIVKLTNEQLADGTKTFLEEINAKTKLIDSKINLSNQENELYKQYYRLLNDLSILNKTILLSKDQTCNRVIVDNPLLSDNEGSNGENLLLDDNNVSDATTVPNNDDNVVTENDNGTLGEDVAKVIGKTQLSYDRNNLIITLPITSNSFTIKRVNPNDLFKFKLDSIAPDLLKTILIHLDEISEVRLESYTSSEYTKYINQSLKVQADANFALSLRRGNKVKQYFLDVASENNLDRSTIQQLFNVYGMGPTNLITDASGVEDRQASRRIEIKIIKK